MIQKQKLDVDDFTLIYLFSKENFLESVRPLLTSEEATIIFLKYNNPRYCKYLSVDRIASVTKIDSETVSTSLSNGKQKIMNYVHYLTGALSKQAEVCIR